MDYEIPDIKAVCETLGDWPDKDDTTLAAKDNLATRLRSKGYDGEVVFSIHWHKDIGVVLVATALSRAETAEQQEGHKDG